MVTEIRLGSVTGSHGIKGWVKVFSYTDPVEAILGYAPWILRKGGITRKVEVETGQVHGKKLIAHVEGVDDRNLAEELTGFEIYVEKEALQELGEGDFYWFQLEGLRVVNSDGDLLGEVDHLLETGANDVMVVRPFEESIDSEERLIPYVEGQVVLEVDREIGEIHVEWSTDY
ncbi:MAG: ribosome maturation factor RimM [Gammaproteobacteria bacterium]|nr:ribosome maturation factor RimM [Gammaproteobacteria bacterium]MBT4493958.1 ribosome maturation factor RimM [Gammaproteobacteria bacterium]MBT7370013.1 ribosome maturation factor RimM [Gammaproteobacteria bacterium]